MPRPRRPHTATLREVPITREGDCAVIEFLKPGIATTPLRIDPEVAYMSNHEILDLFNESVLAQERAQASYRHVGLEIPEGRPQVRYSERFDH